MKTPRQIAKEIIAKNEFSAGDYLVMQVSAATGLTFDEAEQLITELGE